MLSEAYSHVGTLRSWTLGIASAAGLSKMALNRAWDHHLPRRSLSSIAPMSVAAKGDADIEIRNDIIDISSLRGYGRTVPSFDGAADGIRLGV
jgi:hypothetical protein